MSLSFAIIDSLWQSWGWGSLGDGYGIRIDKKIYFITRFIQ